MSGTQVVSYTYDSWGKPLSCTGSLASTLGAVNPFRYRGYIYDEETGLYYLQSRYYNPEWGRFISADIVVGKPGSLLDTNVYTYCNNNPVNCIDKNGYWVESAVDIASIGLDVYDLTQDSSDVWNWVALVVDVVCLALPVVEGGGLLIKGATKAVKAVDAASDINKAEKAIDGAVDVIKSGERSKAALAANDAKRIQNAANKTKQEITVVGSRASGTATPMSDWDYFLSGNSKQRHSARNSLPKGIAGGENDFGIDIFTNNPRSPFYREINKSLPYIKFYPQ